MSVGRVCVYGCGGIKHVGSCVARQACYLVDEELLPGKMMILCVPALLRGVVEDVAMIERNPTIVIEGCARYCGSNVLRLVGITPAATISVEDVMAETGLKPGKARRALDGEGQALARELARRVAGVAQQMLRDEVYCFEKRQVRTEGSVLGESDLDVFGALEYQPLGGGLYRPRSMPPLPQERGAPGAESGRVGP